MVALYLIRSCARYSHAAPILSGLERIEVQLNHNAARSFCFCAIADGKPDSTFPAIAPGSAQYAALDANRAETSAIIKTEAHPEWISSRINRAPESDVTFQPLQRFDRDLAELHHAGAPLQCEVPVFEHTVVELRSLLPVEHHGDLSALGGDLESVPFASRFRHWIHLGEIDDQASAVRRIRARVEYIDLVAFLGADRFRVLAAHENAAVGFLIRPELGVDHVVLV